MMSIRLTLPMRALVAGIAVAIMLGTGMSVLDAAVQPQAEAFAVEGGEAVREGARDENGAPDERPILEVSSMALVAYLAAQVNALHDRLDAAGL